MPLTTRQHNDNGLTRIEAIVILGVVLMSAGVLFPYINRERASGRRRYCEARQIRIGQAIHGFHETYQRFPGFADALPDQRAAVSWQVAILPFLQHEGDSRAGPWRQVYDAFGEPGFEPPLIPDMACPADTPPNRNARRGWSSWVANTGMPDGKTAPRDWPANGVFLDMRAGNADGASVSLDYVEAGDGTAYTYLISENVDSGRWLDKAESLTGFVWVANMHNGQPDPAPDLLRFNDRRGQGDGSMRFARPSSHHGGGAHVTWCDGRVRFVSDQIDYLVFTWQMTPDGEACRHPSGELVEAPYRRQAGEGTRR